MNYPEILGPSAPVITQRTAGQSRQLQLGQVQNVTADITSVLYSPNEGVCTHIKKVYVCNTTGAAATFRMFHDEDGATYSALTALYYDKTAPANDALVLDLGVYSTANGTSGNLAVSGGTLNALTFTAYGEEINTRAR